MGSVYLAEDEALSRRVALKVILPELSRDTSFRRRFEDEARSAAAIDHMNVVPIYSAGSVEGRLYLAMRYVEGSDLESKLNSSPGETLDTLAALEIVRQVAAALDAAHERGLVHRDVKPGNVLLERDVDRVFLTDFGLTRPVGSGGGFTQTGQVVASLDYAAPEQVKSGWVDARTDVYALGCVLYRMLSGSVPHQVTDAQKIWSIVEDPIPRIPHVPDAVNEVIQRATAKRQEDRYPSAGDLASAAVRAGSGISGPTAEQSVAMGLAATGISEAVADDDSTRVMPDEVFVSTQATTPLPRSGESNRRTRRSGRIAAIGGGAFVLAAGIVVAVLIASGGSDIPRTIIRTTEATVTEELPASTNEAKDEAVVGKVPDGINGQGEPLSWFEGTTYSLLAPTLWDHDIVEQESEEAGFYTNIWRESSDPENTYIRADGGNPESASDPQSASEGLVEQVREADGYVEFFYGLEFLRGREAARWVYKLEGDKRVDYFFVECGRGLAVLGSTSPARFSELSSVFREVAASASVECFDY